MKIIAGDELTWAARQNGDREALVFGDRSYSYREIDDRSNRLANALIGLGLAPEDRVAVLLNNCVESVETVFGVTKAGLAYVALNARHTVLEHVDILRDSEASVVIAGPEFQAVATEAAAQVPSVRFLFGVNWQEAEADRSYERLLDDASNAEPAVEIDDDAITRIIYTSGTTGKPKGIVYSHARFRDRLNNFFAALEYRLGVEDSIIHVGPLTHAAGNYLIPYYLRGARNMILPRFDPVVLLETVERRRVTHLLLVPTMIARLLDTIERSGKRYDLSSLTCINYGTAPTPVHIVRRALETFGPIMRQHLGMSECPQPLTVLYPHEHVLEGEERVVRRLASCGRATMNVRATVRGSDDSELPCGEVGEIAIEAKGVADVTYWKRPQLKAETVRNGWFYTGDVGWIDEDGFLFIVGRTKDMVISGGFNIYAREVEDALLRNPEIEEAAIVGLPDPEWGEMVVAAVVPRNGGDIGERSIIDGCRDYIASYKKPKRVLFVDTLPRNMAGKVNKAELRESLLERVNAETKTP